MPDVGRPLKFKTVKTLQKAIDAYFKVTLRDEWTITGLALALDTTRQTLMDYENRDEFADTVKKAKLRIENGYEIDLKKHGRSGTIFALKNFDWRDRQETDITSKGKQIMVKDVSEMSPEEINEYLREKLSGRSA